MRSQLCINNVLCVLITISASLINGFRWLSQYQRILFRGLFSVCYQLIEAAVFTSKSILNICMSAITLNAYLRLFLYRTPIF